MSNIRKWLRQRKLAKLSRTVDHHCFTCNWFKMNTEGQLKGNRGCKYPKAITREQWPRGGKCGVWTIALDIESRETGIFGIVQ